MAVVASGAVVASAAGALYLASKRMAGKDFSGKDLSGADLWGANLKHAVLTGARLEGADLQGTKLEGADFTGAELAGAFRNLKSTWLKDTKGLDDYALAAALEVPGSSVPKVMVERGLIIDDRFSFETTLLHACTPYPVHGTTPYTPAWGFHPVVVFEVVSGRYQLSSEPEARQWEPVAMRHVQLVACIERGWEPVEQCTGWYERDTNIPIDMKRERSWARLRLIAAFSGEVVADMHFRGPNPGLCPSPRRYRTFHYCPMLSEYALCPSQVGSTPVFPQRIQGEKVPTSEIVDAIRPFAEAK